MKKWLSILVFVIIMFFSNEVLANTTYEVQKTTKILEYRSFSSPVKGTFEPGDVVEVFSKTEQGWWNVRGPGPSFIQGWIAPEGVQVQIDRVFEAYDFLDLINKHVFNPQTVIARDWKANGNIQIDTSLGPKWTGVNGVSINMAQGFNAYDSPWSTNPIAWFAPQPVNVWQTMEEGWSQIDTSLGKKWIVRFPHAKKIIRPFCGYGQPTYEKGTNFCFDPQTVKVFKSNDNGWIQIQSSVGLGYLWVAPNGSYHNIATNFSAYDSPYFAKKPVATFAPQTVFVKEESVSPFGWLKIKTSLGDKWIDNRLWIN